MCNKLVLNIMYIHVSGFIWLRIGSSEGFWEHGHKNAGPLFSDERLKVS